MACQRRMVDDGMSPDHLATIMGREIDDACTRWRLSVISARSTPSYELEELRPDPILGAQEAAAAFGWKLRTFHQWQHRRQTPTGDMIVNGAPAWYRSTLERWAEDTGRDKRSDALEDF